MARQGDDPVRDGDADLGRVEVEVPLGSGGRELGLRPSIFMDVGALWGVPKPDLINEDDNTLTCITPAPTEVVPNPSPICNTSPGFVETFVGDSPSPRISVGVGVSWNSPFGPFRFDLAKALKKVDGDDTQVFQFNVGTQF